MPKYYHRAFYYFVISLPFFFNACQPDQDRDFPVLTKNETFIHISHTSITGVSNKLDSLVQRIPLSKYDLVLLGGDLCENSSLDISTMYYIDSIFDINNPKTLWSIGNHDYDNLSNFSAVNNKPRYYARFHHGITFLVLDTQDSLSNFIGNQLQLIENVTDTINESEHLIVMSHKMIWMLDSGPLEPRINTTSNGPTGTCHWCINDNNFYTDVYPRLLQVKSRGINIICVGGDIGKYVQQFSYTTPDDIEFLASGICSGCAVNYCLVFEYNIGRRELTWNYQLLTDLATNPYPDL